MSLYFFSFRYRVAEPIRSCLAALVWFPWFSSRTARMYSLSISSSGFHGSSVNGHLHGESLADLLGQVINVPRAYRG